jgi:hypothetical protein
VTDVVCGGQVKEGIRPTPKTDQREKKRGQRSVEETEEMIEVEELCEMYIYPKQGEFHSETKQIGRLSRVTCGHERSGEHYADGLLLLGVFHVTDVGADAGEEGD